MDRSFHAGTIAIAARPPAALLMVAALAGWMTLSTAVVAGAPHPHGHAGAAAARHSAHPAHPRTAGKRRPGHATRNPSPAHQGVGLARKAVDAVMAARRRVDADPSLLLAIAWKESSFDPRARNRQSSARGLLQFTTATWLCAIRDFGARHGLARYAAAIRTDREGRVSVHDRRLRRTILELRNDPRLSAVMAAERLRRDRAALEAQLGRPATPADLYLVHLLGVAGATRFLVRLAEQPDSASTAVVGDAARPNRPLFVHNGRTLTVAEAYAGIRTTLDEQAILRAPPVATVADGGSPD